MRQLIPVALGESTLFGGAGLMEALGFSLPTWAWATVFAVGVGGLVVWYAIVKPANADKTIRRILQEKGDAQNRRAAEAMMLHYIEDPEKRDRAADKLSEKWEKERLRPFASADDKDDRGLFARLFAPKRKPPAASDDGRPQ